jgi:iron complex transport system substrate-binding protein
MRLPTRHLWPGVLTLAALLLTACGDGTSGTATTATATAPATGPATPRIVSTVPAATLNLLLIGGDQYLVGVSSYDHIFLPESEQNLPVVGDYEQTHYEELVKLRPTVMIIQQEESRQSPRLRQFVRDRNIELLNMKFDHVADIWTSARLLAKACDRQAQTEDIIADAQRQLAALDAQYRNAPRPRVLYLMDPSSNLACGNHTFVEEMITLAGGENSPVGDGFVTVGRETMVKLAPDVLLIGAPDSIPEIDDDPRLAPWLSLPVPAARNKRVFLVTDGNSQMPSVDIGKNVRALADLIHRHAPAATTQAPTGRTGAGGEGGGG